MIWDNGREQTRLLEQNILNLSFAQFEGVGKYEIPMILPEDISDEELKTTPLQGFNFAKTEKYPSQKAVHFFLHDYQFERVWNYPDRYIDMLKQFKFVLSPQFSTYEDMPMITKVFNIYRNRWCGRYWQERGITVIPTFAYGGDENFEWCFEGLPKHSIIAVSTMGDGRWGGNKSVYKVWDKLMEVLEPRTVILYGKDLSNNLNGNIIYKKLISSRAAI